MAPKQDFGPRRQGIEMATRYLATASEEELHYEWAASQHDGSCIEQSDLFVSTIQYIIEEDIQCYLK